MIISHDVTSTLLMDDETPGHHRCRKEEESPLSAAPPDNYITQLHFSGRYLLFPVIMSFFLFVPRYLTVFCVPMYKQLTTSLSHHHHPQLTNISSNRNETKQPIPYPQTSCPNHGANGGCYHIGYSCRWKCNHPVSNFLSLVRA